MNLVEMIDNLTDEQRKEILIKTREDMLNIIDGDNNEKSTLNQRR